MVPILMFLFASTLSRGMRYLLLALLIYKYGSSIKSWIDKYFNLLTSVTTILIIIIIVLVNAH